MNRDAFPLPIGVYDRDDELLAATADDQQPRLKVYSAGEVVVVLGRGSKPERELNLEACAEDQVRIQRRRGGGCAVVLDPGNVIVSLVLAVPGIGDSPRYFRAICAWLSAGLAQLGAREVCMRGTSDLCQGDHKVGGSCIYRSRGLLYFSTTLLCAPRLELMERYLLHPPREPDYRRGREHRRFVGQLQTELAPLEVDIFVDKLQGVLAVAALELPLGARLADHGEHHDA